MMIELEPSKYEVIGALHTAILQRNEARAQRDALRNKVQAHIDALDAHIDTLDIPFEDGGYEASEAARRVVDSTFAALREALAEPEDNNAS